MVLFKSVGIRIPYSNYGGIFSRFDPTHERDGNTPSHSATAKAVLMRSGDAENAGVENAARSKLPGVENAREEISGGRLFERM